MNDKSCLGCKFLYTQGIGYSSYTWEETEVNCAKNLNANLPDEEPYDWNKEVDNWPATMTSKCSLYAPGNKVDLDVDGDDGPADYTDDEEAIIAICEHSGRKRNGY